MPETSETLVGWLRTAGWLAVFGVALIVAAAWACGMLCADVARYVWGEAQKLWGDRE